MKVQWMAEVDLLTGENVANAKALLEQIKEDLLEQMRPAKFNENDPKSIIHKREESFERLCFQLRKHNIQSPEKLSTYTFYSSVQLIKEEVEAQTKQAR
jgi:negative regulator of sigma E activity